MKTKRAKPGPKGHLDEKLTIRLDNSTKLRLFRVGQSQQPPVSASHVALKLILEGLDRKALAPVGVSAA